MFFFADTLPDPNSYAAIGWGCVILAAIAFGLNQGLELVNLARGKAPHPPNAQLEAAVQAVAERVRALEDWKESLMAKLDADKMDVLNAGENRASGLHKHIEDDRKEVDRKIDNLPERIINILKQTGALDRH
jgi:hypothetical protein